MDVLLIYAATGAVAGVLAGLFGAGGGLIMVPALAWLMPALGYADAYVMQMAIGTSLAVIAVTSISSTLAHHRRQGVRWPLWWRITPGLVLGTWLGAAVADDLSAVALMRIVGTGALLVSLQMLLSAQRERPASSAEPGTAELTGMGGVIGALSSLIGIGGGSLTVPYFSWRGLSIREAVGTAAACGAPIAWAGAVGYALTGLDEPIDTPWTLGYISLRAFVGLALASALAAPLGARWAHQLPAHLLKRLFAVVLAVIGLRMLLA